MEKEQKQTRYPWHLAPEWANYAATSGDGRRWWFEKRPDLYSDGWWNLNGQKEEVPSDCPEFAETLETRPDNI